MSLRGHVGCWRCVRDSSVSVVPSQRRCPIRIDELAITGQDRERVNAAFSEAFHWANTVDYDSMINQWMFGGDCVELLVGGELWLVCDTRHSEFDAVLDTDIRTAVYYHCNELRGGEAEQWICNHELFKLVSELSPLESCEATRLRMLTRRWFEIGSKPGLELFLQSLPAPARADYCIEWIDGDEYGLRFGN